MNSTFPSALQPLNQQLLEKVIQWLPIVQRNLLRAFPQLFLAGGYIRGVVGNEGVEGLKDVDLFTTDLSIVDRAVEFYIRQCEFADPHPVTERETPCTITVENGYYAPAQFVNNVAYVSPEECIHQFDFTICQAAVWYDIDGWRSLCSPEFIRDVALRRLVYTSPKRIEAPGGSLWRAVKYAQRGYSISQDELTKLVVRLNSQTMHFYRDVSGNPWEYDAEDHGRIIKRSFSLPMRNGSIAISGDY